MDVIVPGPMAVMSWIEKEVAKAIKRGETQIQWVTPSGFVVTQKLMKKKYERVVLQLMGKVNMRVATGDSDEVDINHHKNATAPNLIHSLDASILHLSAMRFDAPISPHTRLGIVVLQTWLLFQPSFVRYTCTCSPSMTFSSRGQHR